MKSYYKGTHYGMEFFRSLIVENKFYGTTWYDYYHQLIFRHVAINVRLNARVTTIGYSATKTTTTAAVSDPEEEKEDEEEYELRSMATLVPKKSFAV